MIEKPVEFCTMECEGHPVLFSNRLPLGADAARVMDGK